MKRSLSLLSMFLIVVGHVFAQGPTGTPPPVVVSQVTVSNDTKRLVFPTPLEFAQGNDLLQTNGSALNLTNFPSYLLTNNIINGRLGTVSNRMAVTTLSLQDVTSADGTNMINGTLQSSEISGYVIVTNFLIATQVPGLPQANWRGLATSSNGQCMVATASGGYVYVTTNGGSLWTAQTGLGIYDWNPPAMSKDGSIIFLCGGDTPLYRSTNYGSSWASIDGGAYNRSDVSCSDDGKVMAFCYPGTVTMNWSTNFGTPMHFENIQGFHPHVSGDGKTLTRFTFVGGLSYSMSVAYNDLGNDYPVWTTIGGWDRISYVSQAMSYDGSIMYWTFSGTGGQNWPAYLSTNRGVSYVGILPASTWGDIDCTPDGSKIQVMSVRNGNGFPGQVLLSTDFGSTWTSNGIAIDEVGTVYTPYWYYQTGFMQPDGLKGYAAKAGDANGVYYAITLGTEMTQSVSIVSDVHITGSMTVDGGIYGSALNLTNFGTILPASSNAYDIGSSDMPFRHGYFGSNSLYLGPYRMGVNSNGSLTYNDYPVVSTGGTSIAVDTNMQAQMNATTQRVSTLEQMTDTWNTVTSKLATNGSASGLTNFPVNVVQTNQATYTTTVAKASTAWQNPSSATNWTWTSDGREITLTGYLYPQGTYHNAIVPDMLDGLPVTSYNGVFSGNGFITGVIGGKYVKTIADSEFVSCNPLSVFDFSNIETIGTSAFNGTSIDSVNFPSLKNVGNQALSFTSLKNIVMPSVTNIGFAAFGHCVLLTNVTLLSKVTIGDSAFADCASLRSVMFDQDAPPEASDVFSGIPANQVTNYVMNPTATGWGSTWNGRPVVRLNTYANESYVGPSAGTNLPVYVTLTNLASRIDSSTNYVAGIIAGSGKLWMTDNGATSILYHVTSGGRTNKIGEYFSTP